MTLELVAQGTNINEAKEAERYLPEGSDAELRLYLSDSAPGWSIWTLENSLKAVGVPLRGPVEQTANVISIKWRKGFAWLPLIVIALVAIGIIASLLISWQLLKVVGGSPLLLIGLGLLAFGVVSQVVKSKGVGHGR